MDIVPESLQKIIAEHEEELEAYFSEQVFAKLVIRNRAHLLVMLSKHLDLKEIEKECQSYHLWWLLNSSTVFVTPSAAAG